VHIFAYVRAVCGRSSHLRSPLCRHRASWLCHVFPSMFHSLQSSVQPEKVCDIGGGQDQNSHAIKRWRYGSLDWMPLIRVTFVEILAHLFEQHFKSFHILSVSDD